MTELKVIMLCYLVFLLSGAENVKMYFLERKKTKTSYLKMLKVSEKHCELEYGIF